MQSLGCLLYLAFGFWWCEGLNCEKLPAKERGAVDERSFCALCAKILCFSEMFRGSYWCSYFREVVLLKSECHRVRFGARMLVPPGAVGAVLSAGAGAVARVNPWRDGCSVTACCRSFLGVQSASFGAPPWVWETGCWALLPCAQEARAYFFVPTRAGVFFSTP